MKNKSFIIERRRSIFRNFGYYENYQTETILINVPFFGAVSNVALDLHAFRVFRDNEKTIIFMDEGAIKYTFKSLNVPA